MKSLFGGLMVFIIGAAIFLYFVPRSIVIKSQTGSANYIHNSTSAATLPLLPEAGAIASTTLPAAVFANAAEDLPPQPHLLNPPEVVRGIYITAWSAGYAQKINSLIGLIKRTNLNAVVIDIKDYSGSVSYKTGIADVAAAGAENNIKILQPNALLKKLHDAGIYVVGRITVFQDPVLAKAHPEWALRNKTTGKIWTDKKGLAWMDAAAKPVWEYNAAIAKEALARGFDEIQFDYVRFASDGDLSNVAYPYWDGHTPRRVVIEKFFKFLRDGMPDAKLSADLFGLSTVNTDDLGIGQVIEDAYKYFDYVSPMVYPSHYAAGFLGYQNPAKFPYEVIKYSLEKALARLQTMTMAMTNDNESSTASSSLSTVIVPKFVAKLRPWLQDFDLGAVYDASMVKKEIQATEDVLEKGSTTISLPPGASASGNFGGWLLWDPANIYTEGALQARN
jgi:hypothetical protein